MGTKTVDEAGVKTGAEAKSDEENVNLTKSDEATEAEAASADTEVAATETEAAANDTEAASNEAEAASNEAEAASNEAEAASNEAEAVSETAETDSEAADDLGDDDLAGDLSEESEEPAEGPSGVGQGAAAVVSAALGLVALTGSWVGTVASARENIIGQLETSQGASVATQVKAMYGNAWHTTALWGGLFALLALIVGVVVLARPAFGAPGKPQAPWIKSVAWGGVALGVIGLLLAVLKYTDVLLGLPSTS